MKVSMLTFSQTGNTLKVGRTVAQTLASRGLQVDHVRFLDRKAWRPQGADVIGVGCPCFESRPADIVPAYLQQRGFDFSGKKAFVFITSSSSPAKTLYRLAQAVERTGAEVVGGVQAVGVSTAPSMFGLTPDRPDPTDHAHVDAFASALADHLLGGAELPQTFRIDPNRGSVFFDQLGHFVSRLKPKLIPPPVVDPDKCQLCGDCVYECPTANMRIVDKKLAVGDNCTVCWRCWHVCAEDAVSMKLTPGFNGAVEHFLWSERLERFFGELAPGQDRGKNLFRDAFARRVRLKYDRKSPTAAYEWVE